MRERAAHVGRGAVAVVGQRLAVYGDAGRAVALVDDLLVVRGILAGAERLVDGGLDLVLRQGVALGLLDGGRQRRVVLRVRVAALFRGHRDDARQLGEQGRALRVLRRLAVFRCSPLRMPRHILPFHRALSAKHSSTSVKYPARLSHGLQKTACDGPAGPVGPDGRVSRRGLARGELTDVRRRAYGTVTEPPIQQHAPTMAGRRGTPASGGSSLTARQPKGALP